MGSRKLRNLKVAATKSLNLGISSYNFIEGVLNNLKRKQIFTIDKGLEIVEKNGKLTASEIEKIRKHPYYTYKILQTLGEKYSWIAKVAYQEQEREGGQGYPRGS